MSDIYWLMTGMFNFIIFCKRYIINAVIIEKPIPTPIPFVIPDKKFLIKYFFVLPVSSIKSKTLFLFNI